MLKTTKNINLNGSSSVDIEERSIVIMTMNAQISTDESYSINKYIQNKTLYEEHKAVANSDFAAFEEYVDNVVNGTIVSE